MNTQRHILVATDFSEPARAAADRALALAHARRAPLCLVHARQGGELLDELAGRWPGFDPLHLRGALLDALERERERLGTAVDCTTRLVDVPLHRALPGLLEDVPAQLLVMGARGASDWADAVLGSTVDRVLRTQCLPVLVVRSPAASADYARVALATDFSAASEAAARFAMALLPAATHLLLHVSEPLFDSTLAFAGVEQSLVEDYQRRAAQQAMADLESFAGRVGGPATRAVPALRSGRPSHEIARFVAEAGIDLMVVGAQGRSRIEVGLLGSVSRHLASNLPCDVLVVPDPAA